MKPIFEEKWKNLFISSLKSIIQKELLKCEPKIKQILLNSKILRPILNSNEFGLRKNFYIYKSHKKENHKTVKTLKRKAKQKYFLRLQEEN